MKVRFEHTLEAYRDGALSTGKSRRIARRISEDPEAQSYLRQGEALSRLVRESWTEGPPSPPPERFLAAIRPELARVDAERARRAEERSWLGRARSWLQPVSVAPLGFGGVGAFAGAAAVITLAVSGFWGPLRPGVPEPSLRAGLERGLPLAAARGPADDSIAEPPFARGSGRVPSELVAEGDAYGALARAPFSSRTSIYDVHQGDAGLLIYDGEDDSPLLIFTLPDPDEARPDVSFQKVGLGGWS